mmetsp:Transcript_33958/g.60005  ORF Transcript_33958/g.60005 Transcript_33958/m.60005 type:complete len:598 (-) Transcript_33958:125-1918(-)
MVDHATAKYLNDNIGGVLAKALAEMAVAQPTDGVDFLSTWLRTYAEQEDVKAWREKEEQQLAEDREKTQAKEAQKEAIKKKKTEDKKAVTDYYQALLDKFNDPDQMFKDSFWNDIVDVAQHVLGAKSVYLGIMDEEGLEDVEAPCIRYENVSAGSEWMLEKVLPKETGITYGALKESPPEEEQAGLYLWKPPAPEPAPPPTEEGEPPKEEAGLKYYPVYAKYVTDITTVHYFDMPRLGAFLAVPLVFPTYYNADAFAEAKKFEEEKAKEAEEKRLAEEAAAAAAAEGGEGEAAAAAAEAKPDEEAVPEKQMVLPGVPVKMVLCMDTLGTNTAFDEEKFQDMLALCNACGECKARSEMKEIDEQALFAINAERRNSVTEAIASVQGEQEAQVQEVYEAAKTEIANMGLDPEPKAAREELLQKKFKFLVAKQVVVEQKDAITEFLEKYMTVPPEVLNVLAAIAFLVGYTKAQVYPARKTALKLPKLKTVMDDMLFEKIDKLELEEERKGLTPEQKLSYIKGTFLAPLGEFNETFSAKEIDPYFELLYSFIVSACDFRTAHLAFVKSQYELRKQQAETADPPQPFTEPPPTELDDDMEEA